MIGWRAKRRNAVLQVSHFRTAAAAAGLSIVANRMALRAIRFLLKTLLTSSKLPQEEIRVGIGPVDD
ncbi:unnamed protein product [Caenorhabditis auriculariae]|uniref:Uncharacterized protein n=1 Tax=Caenorhabditis auriculariae TaxID=2777116 RepID=A0A8S1H0Q7_9PELO|nr:unnamed protein product [Caenorhabditis auriculariae]